MYNFSYVIRPYPAHLHLIDIANFLLLHPFFDVLQFT